ncbi:MAG: 2-succinyl-6-hydroxy-2,4-cyclohexadiene-1-carboxylate synthase [Calditrichota bacterium]
MIVEARGVRLYVNGTFDPGETDRPPLIFLHGFTLSGREWAPLLSRYAPDFQPLAPDLIGHGASEAPEDEHHYTMEACTSQILEVLQTLEIPPAFWAGYSMGGRVLLSLALREPSVVRAMVLESTTAGIAEPKERQARLRRDAGMAQFIERHPIETFVDRWTAHPIFRSQSGVAPVKREYIRNIRLQNSRIGLANSLRGMGRGAMPYLWTALPMIDIPTLLLAGELDADHVKIAERMDHLLPECQMHIAEGAGHNIHFERPDLFFDITRAFFNSQIV